MTATDDFVRWLQSAAADGERPAVPAATVVLLRDRDDELQTLLIKKASKIAFGGMWVFPGGRIDDGDRLAGAHDDLAAARAAAAREAEEETNLVVEPDDLVRWSFWLPPPQTPRRFATWFFLAAAPEGAVAVDGGEIRDHQWISPGGMLALRDAGEVELAPPTWVTLHQLSEFSDAAEALAAAAARPPARFETRVAKVDDGLAALWHGDAGYEAGDGAATGARHRLVMAEAEWRYERSS